jgi:cation:H+ antiporter
MAQGENMVNFGIIILVTIELLLGVAIIYLASNMLVAAASWLVKTVGVSELWAGGLMMSTTVLIEVGVIVIGLAQGWGGLVLEQIMGVVMTNLGLVLGLGLLIAPPKIAGVKLVKRVIGLMGAWVMLALVMSDGKIEAWEGWALVGWATVVVILGVGELERKTNLVFQGLTRRERWQEQGKGNLLLNLGRILLGGALMLTAVGYVLRNGIFLGQLWHWSMMITAGTILAWGVILPDLSTLISVIVHKKMKLSIGGIIMTNSLILTLVVGLGAILSKQKLLLNVQNWLTNVSGGGFLVNKWRWFGAEAFNREALRVNDWLSREAVIFGLVMTVVAFMPALIKGKFYRWQGISLIVGTVGYFVLRVVL